MHVLFSKYTKEEICKKIYKISNLNNFLKSTPFQNGVEVCVCVRGRGGGGRGGEELSRTL